VVALIQKPSYQDAVTEQRESRSLYWQPSAKYIVVESEFRLLVARIVFPGLGPTMI